MEKRISPHDLGRLGEETAATLLQTEGYKILARNYRCSQGEIDLIAARGNRISFVEVKTRRSFHYGRPCESITRGKRNRIRRTALCYLREQEDRGRFWDEIGFDVLEITLFYTENAF